jgi:hypothetical protein
LIAELERILNAPSENLDSNLPIYGDINEGTRLIQYEVISKLLQFVLLK